MIAFPLTLTVSPLPDGETWYLNGPFEYDYPGGTVKVPQNFETDFASVPQIVQNVFARWGDYGPASVIHDWLYWDQKCERAWADSVFLRAMVDLNVAAWKRQTLYRAVHLFGQSAWDSNQAIAAQGYSRVRTAASPVSPEWTALR